MQKQTEEMRSQGMYAESFPNQVEESYALYDRIDDTPGLTLAQFFAIGARNMKTFLPNKAE